MIELPLNFQEIVLKKDELKALRAIKKRNLHIKNEGIVHMLMVYKLIKPTITDADEHGNLITDGTYEISDKGKRYLIYLRRIHKNTFFEWLRYIVTTVIALIALIRTFLKP